MGNKVATFTEEQLEDYQDCTFFTRKEILRIFKRFREMGDPGAVPRCMTAGQASTVRIPLSCLTRIPELKENPFRQRISEVFTKRVVQNLGQSSLSDDEGICFEEFLEMMSVFSEQAPRDLKVFYAFKIYGTDHRVNQTDRGSVAIHGNQIPRRLMLRKEYRFIVSLADKNFDEDGALGTNDLERTCRQLVQGGLNAEEVATVCRKVLEESDIDGDGVLSYLEFEHVVTRASDFMATFHIRI